MAHTHKSNDINSENSEEKYTRRGAKQIYRKKPLNQLKYEKYSTARLQRTEHQETRRTTNEN